MRDSFLAFSPPSLGQEEIDEVIDTLRSDWITTGPKVKRFEREFAAFIGAPAALAVSSATAAMQVGLAALGIGPGAEVITTPMTFCSTVHVIEQLGARPVLVDVDPVTLTIDPDGVEAAVTPRTRALLPVHLYGHPCDMDRLLAIAERHNLAVVEDAAHALPTRFHGRMIGAAPLVHTTGERWRVRAMTAFSFYATKNLTTGEGGMLSGEVEAIEQARLWSLHGMSRDAYKRYSAEGSWYYEVVLPGFKCNMTDIQAALGLQQLKKLPAFQQRRREIVTRYQAAFHALPEVQTPVELPGAESAWHLYILRLNLEQLRIDRAQFIEELTRRNIGASVHFIPVHIHPYYADRYGYQPADFPIAYHAYQRIVTLPLYPRLGDQDVTDVIGAVQDVVETYRA